MSNVVTQLSNLLDYTRSDDDEDKNEYEIWGDEQLEKARELYSKLDTEYDIVDDKITELVEEKNKLEEKLDDKKLVFYDKERNVPMNR